MSEGSGDKPRGVVEGAMKSLAGLPRSPLLNIREQGVVAELRGNELASRQNTLIERQGERGHEDSRLVLMEMHEMRSVAEEGARAQRASQWAAMEANNQLSTLNAALQSSLPALADGMRGLTSATDQMVGVSSGMRSIEEIVLAYPSLEAEVIILAMNRGLRTEQRDALFDSLPYWKKDIIDSGLVYQKDAEIEGKLSWRERTFLGKLRRKVGSSIITFRSIEVLAQHQMLDYDLHRNLSKTVAVTRTGMVGLVDAANSLEAQGKVANELRQQRLVIGSASLREQERTRVGVNTLVGISRDGLTVQQDIRTASQRTAAAVEALLEIKEEGIGEIRIATQKTAENTLAIERGVAAQVHLTRHFGGRAEVQRERQIDVLEDVERNTGLLAVLAERGNQIGAANLAVSAVTADNTGRLVEIGEVGLGLQASMSRSLDSLVDFSERVERAGIIMIQQDQIRNKLLESVVDHLDMTNYRLALTREEIAELHLTVSQGIAIAAEMDVIKIIAAQRANSLLAILIDRASIQHGEVLEALEGIDRTLQKQHLTENRARAQEKFQEGYGKYKKGYAQQAIDIFTESMKHWSNDYRTYFYRGLCYMAIDKPDEAEIDLMDAYNWAEDTKDPTIMATIKMTLARLHYGESKDRKRKLDTDGSDEKMEQAIFDAQDAWNMDPDLHEAGFALATYLAAHKLYEDARVVLTEIIPKNPEFAQRMVLMEEFWPILEDFRNVVKEVAKNVESNDESKRFSIAVIKDCIKVRDFKGAVACAEELMKNGAMHLLRLKIWEIEELKPIRKQIIEMITRAIDTIEPVEDNSDNCYAIALLAILYREGREEISNSKVFKAFLAGTQDDLDVRAKNKIAMLGKLREMSEQGTETILAINKLHRNGMDWLN